MSGAWGQSGLISEACRPHSPPVAQGRFQGAALCRHAPASHQWSAKVRLAERPWQRLHQAVASMGLSEPVDGEAGQAQRLRAAAAGTAVLCLACLAGVAEPVPAGAGTVCDGAGLVERSLSAGRHALCQGRGWSQPGGALVDRLLAAGDSLHLLPDHWPRCQHPGHCRLRPAMVRASASVVLAPRAAVLLGAVLPEHRHRERPGALLLPAHHAQRPQHLGGSALGPRLLGRQVHLAAGGGRGADDLREAAGRGGHGGQGQEALPAGEPDRGAGHHRARGHAPDAGAQGRAAPPAPGGRGDASAEAPAGAVEAGPGAGAAVPDLPQHDRERAFPAHPPDVRDRGGERRCGGQR